ncbi:MAG: hypothetical protein FGM15_06085 [Chthoniobacterales bacterium]|nr:hypothetical protein [Chthoniobacterales bacterium]
MRATLPILIAVLSAGSCLAQDFVAPKQPRREVAPPPKSVSPLDPDSTLEGVVAAAFQMKQPWQLVNPLAAKGYGDGRYMTSWDPNDEGKPKGFIVFGFRFW